MPLTSVPVRPIAAKNARRFGTTFRKSSRLTACTVAGPANMNVSPYAVAKNAGSIDAVALAYASNNAVTALLASAMPPLSGPYASRTKEGRDDSTVPCDRIRTFKRIRERVNETKVPTISAAR